MKNLHVSVELPFCDDIYKQKLISTVLVDNAILALLSE